MHPIPVTFVSGEEKNIDLGRTLSLEGIGELYEGCTKSWWRCSDKKFTEELDRWTKIEKVMGRGSCRVVLRWEGMSDGPGGFGLDVGKAVQKMEPEEKKWVWGSEGKLSRAQVVEMRERVRKGTKRGTGGGGDEMDVDEGMEPLARMTKRRKF